MKVMNGKRVITDWGAAIMIAAFVVSSAGFFSPAGLIAQMSSTNYSIPADSINFGGGNSTSTNYIIEDTLGEVATGISSSTNYELRAGYQQMNQYQIAISTTGNVNMPNIGGVGADTSAATVTATVTTNNPAGYSLSVRASTDPALQSVDDQFADYTPATADPDFNFSVGDGAAEFGFSPEGDDIADRYRDNGASCATGATDTANACWDAFSTTDKEIANNTNSTDESGTETDIVFQAGIGNNTIQAPGTYNATITVTAITL